MEWKGNLRKLRPECARTTSGTWSVSYTFQGAQILEPDAAWDFTEALGKRVCLEFTGNRHCTVTGKRIRKAYGDGMSFDAWRTAPEAVESVLRPELSKIHEGIALRDAAWERAHHLAPHVTYLSDTGAIKVGVTRSSNALTRWMDQGATAAIRVLDVPYRQLAGEAEVALKAAFTDRTAVSAMLRAGAGDPEALVRAKDRALDLLGEVYEPFMSDADEVDAFVYPVLQWPARVKPVTLEKMPVIDGTLVAIKGAYLVWDTGAALNVRAHAGCEVKLSVDAASVE